MMIEITKEDKELYIKLRRLIFQTHPVLGQGSILPLQAIAEHRIAAEKAQRERDAGITKAAIRVRYDLIE